MSACSEEEWVNNSTEDGMEPKRTFNFSMSLFPFLPVGGTGFGVGAALLDLFVKLGKYFFWTLSFSEEEKIEEKTPVRDLNSVPFNKK